MNKNTDVRLEDGDVVRVGTSTGVFYISLAVRGGIVVSPDGRFKKLSIEEDAAGQLIIQTTDA